MDICILCEDSKLQEVKETAKQLFSGDILKIGLSPTGVAPATYWFCHMTSTDQMYQSLLSLQKYTIIEISNPNDFLTKWNLKPIFDTVVNS